MKKDYCDITMIIDRSGSMSTVKDEVIGSVKNFINDQKKVKGKATITMVQFDDQYQVDYNGIDIQDTPDFEFRPRGMTAMYDAIGRTIVSTGGRLAAMNEDDRPEKVVIMIQTDGAENASKEHTQGTVKKMIKEQEEKYSWEFVFLGSGIDAKQTASFIGIRPANAMTYTKTTDAIGSLSKNLASFRTGSSTTMAYTQQDYDAQ